MRRKAYIHSDSVAEMTVGHTFWLVTHVTHQSIDPWPVTHDYSWVVTPDYCSFQSGPLGLSGSALKIKHHHCHKILRRNNWIKLTCGLSCAVSLYNVWKKRNHGSTGHKYWPVTHVTHSDLLTHLIRDPWPADPLSSLLSWLSCHLLVLSAVMLCCPPLPSWCVITGVGSPAGTVPVHC